MTVKPRDSSNSNTGSGSSGALLRHRPLGTERASFPAFRSSLSKPRHRSRFHHRESATTRGPVTVRVQHHQAATCVRAPVGHSFQVEETPPTGLRDHLTADRTRPLLIQPQPDQSHSRIVKAEQAGRHGRVKALQWLLIHSFSGKALAVKRVTGNRGRKTPGVDGVTWSTPGAKLKALPSAF
ncbi:reverse transcriptase N-terminal domain-containing protein [Paraburkholderia ultramafica]|uniref:reverse transcriptase N-terminal domain-containing protein n=1 Tax=Paraburkholderia ultramafica TaxID=1544867 RepID=UPI003CCD4E95